jgi:hypothetical protein
MTNEDNQPTPEELREQALKVLNDKGISALSAAYVTDENYGPAGKNAVHNFKYLPALTNPEKSVSELITEGLLGSREDGKMYTGNLSEFKLIKKATEMRMGSLGYLKVQDVYELAGSGEKAPAAYANKTIDELSKSEEKADKEFLGKLIKTYQLTFSHKAVEEALGDERKAVVGGLEKEVSE